MKQNHCLLCFQDKEKNISLSQWIKQDSYLCGDCMKQLEILNIHVIVDDIPIHILYLYNEFLENMIYQYKENRDIALKDVFFHQFINKLNDKYRHYEVVVMPSAHEKIEERGFHHMKEMLGECKLPILDPMVKLHNRKQSLQSFQERQNITDYIHLKKNFYPSKKPLLLIDDVITTGATLKHAYHLLSKHTSKIETLILSAHPRFVELCDKK